jgi:hypothetical protein
LPASAAPAPGEKTKPASEGEATPPPADEQPADEAAGETEGEPAATEEGSEPAEGEAEGEADATQESVAVEAPPEPKAEPKPQPPPAEPVAPADADDLAEPTVGGKPRTGKGLMIAGGATLGAGIGLTIGFVMMTRGCSYDGPLQCKYRDQDQFLIPLASAVVLTGVMLLSVGIGYHVHYRKWKRRSQKNVAVAPAMLRGGGGLAVQGRF